MRRILSGRSLAAIMVVAALAAFLIVGTRYATERKMRREGSEAARRLQAAWDADPGIKAAEAEIKRLEEELKASYRESDRLDREWDRKFKKGE